MKLLLLCLLAASVSAFSRNALDLGLVSEHFPMEFWEALASMNDEDLNPEFRKLVLYLDRKRAGNE